MNSFYTKEELDSLGLAAHGDNVLISKKTSIYRPGEIHLGSNIRVEDFCLLLGPLIIGSFVYIAAGSLLKASTNYPIVLEDVTAITPKVTIITSSDDYQGAYLFGPHFPNNLRKIHGGTVTIEKFSLIGAQSLILPNITIRRGSSIGAMSLVTKSTKPWTLSYGIPAKEVSRRDPNIASIFEDFLRRMDLS